MHIARQNLCPLGGRCRVLLTIMLTSFVVEIAAMFLLPLLLPPDVHPWIEAICDSMLLSLGSLPWLWFLLIRPMYIALGRWSHRSEALMRALDEHALVSITDSHGKIIYANDAFCRTSQYSVDELVGKHHRIVNSGYHSKAFMKSMWDTIKRGESWQGEIKNRAKDGSFYWVQSTIMPFKHARGSIEQYIAIRTNITEHKRMEEGLRQLSIAVEQSPTSVVITNKNGVIEYVNPRFTEVTGYAKEEAIGQNPRILKSGRWPTKSYKGLWNTILSGKTWRGELENRRKSGEIFWEAASISPVYNERKEITHFLAVKEDITERKRIERQITLYAQELEGQHEELEARNQKIGAMNASLEDACEKAANATRAKSEFLANMSHEIRTPMTAILGFAENMLDADQSEAERMNCVHTIRRNGEYLLELINDILDLSKIEADKMTVEHRACQPCQIVADVASLMHVRADEKKLPFTIEYRGAIPEKVSTDPTRLRQVLINLIGNAIKFTETGAVRLVTQFVDDGHTPCLQFDVIDTGYGMTVEQKNKLFQPFSQADTSTTRKFGGTGLGLAISKRFAEMLGGDIAIVQTEPGAGSTFRVTVATGPLDGVKMLEDPLAATVVDDSAAPTTPVSSTSLKGLRILLAEDGLDNQRLISFVLKKAGANVTIMANGKLALDAVLAARDDGKPFDCILMDMQMPVMDGYEATGQLRQEGHTGPIIALTAHAMASDREKCLKAGCDDYATKPIDRKKLEALIGDYVARHRRKTHASHVTSTEPPPLRGCHVLLAEDNASNQSLVVGILKRAGAETTIVGDGQAAVEDALAARDKDPAAPGFDCILMDMQMPVMDGYGATKELRQKGYAGPIIALTAHAMVSDREKCLKAGCDAYVTKPIDRKKLIKTIQRLVVPEEVSCPVST